MKIIKQTKKLNVYKDKFMGYDVIFYKQNLKNSVLIDANLAARKCGIANNLEEFLGTDEGMEAINNLKEKYPDIFGDINEFKAYTK